ncbi:cyclohexyl-isocyanide hydratase [Micromonospora citrea]|uniref:Cyclohexyl-isocyanide hydratase n=1 Tax=Micromonospora citrea TaxID=47855 RepID=A0A1C6VQW8_9ACTN|nr:DJ-1/PfpI family protein [Micromonospora citrea]SCL68592.1 cyclohexyl-isocyanide hydratase [Micromonospora citrea]
MPDNPNRRQLLTLGAALAATGLTVGDAAPAAARHSAPAGGEEPLDIAFLVFDGLVPLDLVGPLSVLGATGRAGGPPARLHFVGPDLTPIPGGGGLQWVPTATYDTLPRPDVLVVPGPGQPSILMRDRRLLDYIRAAHPHTRVTFGICTGVLLLAAAGILRGRSATTYWAFADELPLSGARFRRRRWVVDGRIVTSAGVSAGMDAALVVAARLWGERAAGRGQAFLEYDPEPPFDYGRVENLPDADEDHMWSLFQAERARVREVLT